MAAVGEVWEFCVDGFKTTRCRIDAVRASGTLEMRDVDSGELIPNQYIEHDNLERDLRWTLVDVSGGGDSQ